MGGVGSGPHKQTETAKQIRARLQQLSPMALETIESPKSSPDDRNNAWRILEHSIGKAPMSVDLSGSLQIEDIRVAVERVASLPTPTPEATAITTNVESDLVGSGLPSAELDSISLP